MEITEEKVGRTTIFRLKGRLDTTTSSQVEQELTSSIHAGSKNLLLDFSDIDYISSAGIRVLLNCRKELEKRNGQIFLISVPKAIENVLYITGFLPYFRLFDKQSDAISALNEQSK